MRLSLRELIAFFFVGVCAATATVAAPPNPQLSAFTPGDPEQVSRALDIDLLEVEVEIVGHVAETTVTARFANPKDDTLEGTFTLQMPDGAIVTGYALDIEGRMIDGVLMPPVRARLAFEEKERAGIDPGLGEVRHGNVFSTRVFPIEPGSGRTVRLRFAAPMPATRGYVLPLVSGTRIERVKLAVRVRKSGEPPTLDWPVGAKSEWRREDGDLVNDLSLQGQALDGDLSIASAGAGRAFVTRHPSGRRFVELHDVADDMLDILPVAVPPPPRRVRIFWDRSSSRRDDALAREHELLERFLAANDVSDIEVVAFNSSGATRFSTRDRAVAMRELRALDYRGATSFAVLSKPANARRADLCLLFSDGVATIDARPELRFDCPMHAIASAADADFGYLGLLARAHRGSAISLARTGVDEALRRMLAPGPRVVAATSDAGESLRFAVLEADARGWAIVAEAPAHGDLILRIAGFEGGSWELRYPLLDDLGQFSGAGALWAGDRIMQLVGNAESEIETFELSRRFSVASPALAFIVFESPWDYIKAGIEPPPNYPEEARAEYLEAKQEAEEEEAFARAEWLDELVALWEEQKEWWEADYEAAKREESPGASAPAAPATSAAAASAPSAPAGGSSPAEALQRTVRGTAYAADEDVSEVMVTGLRASLEPYPTISLTLEPWEPDRPYLKALEAVGVDEYARELEAQESLYGGMPAFYFDVAEWLYRRKRVSEAIEMLLSALELPAQDSQTLSVVADRLKRYGAIDRAIWAYEQVRRLEPHRPQPARNLALALASRAQGAARSSAARADLERALALLTEVIMTPVDEDYRGIELVALTDANEIIPRLRAAGSRHVDLDPRLIALLSTDLRVVIEWNTPGTDMDLWVEQPDGERSLYSNDLTGIGGQLSNDMTHGYGPEQYLLRRAIDGEYAIKVDVYATDAINPNGTTMVTAHLTRNYGRRNQRSETMELELKPDDEGELLVGRFRVGPGQRRRE